MVDENINSNTISWDNPALSTEKPAHLLCLRKQKISQLWKIIRILFILLFAF